MWCYQPMSRGSWCGLVTCVRCGASPSPSLPLAPPPSLLSPLSSLPSPVSRRSPTPHFDLTLKQWMREYGRNTEHSLHSALQVQDKKTSAVTGGQTRSLRTPYCSLSMSSHASTLSSHAHSLSHRFTPVREQQSGKWAGGTSQLC